MANNHSYAKETRNAKNAWKYLSSFVLTGILLAGVFSAGALPQAEALLYSSAKNLSNTFLMDSRDSDIAVSGDSIYVSYTEGRGNTTAPYNVFFTKSTDGGVAFSIPKQLTFNGETINADETAISLTGSNVYIVYGTLDDATGNDSIYFLRSIDGGNTFSMPKLLSGSQTDAKLASITSTGKAVYVAWENEGTLNFVKSTDTGINFSNPLPVAPMDADSEPKMAVSSKTVYIAFEDPTEHIALAKSIDGGVSFGPIKVVYNQQVAFEPAIAVNGKVVYVAFTVESVPSDFDILLTKSIDGGNTFDQPRNVSANSTTFGVFPDIVLSTSANGNTVFVTWTSFDTLDVYLAKSTNAGGSFSIDNVSNNDESSAHSKVAAFGTRAFLVWQENVPGHGGNFDIFFTKTL